MANCLYLECNSGISGDMLVAALLDLGADREALAKALDSLPVQGFTYAISTVKKAGVVCCDFDVVLDAEHENHHFYKINRRAGNLFPFSLQNRSRIF